MFLVGLKPLRANFKLGLLVCFVGSLTACVESSGVGLPDDAGSASNNDVVTPVTAPVIPATGSQAPITTPAATPPAVATVPPVGENTVPVQPNPTNPVPETPPAVPPVVQTPTTPDPTPVVVPTPVSEGVNIDGLPGPTSGVFARTATDIGDIRGLYFQDGYQNDGVIRVDVRTVTTPGICTIDDLSGCTLADVIADINGDDKFKVEIPIHFQSSDFPDDGSVANATLRQRGQFSRTAPQKSFRIKLDSKQKEDLWRNERRLQLNKHPFDKTRIRNKVAFDLLSEMPHIPSLRTQFINLWIDDGAGPVDYGVFTHVEFAGREYLENRGLDKDHNLYKAEFFRFDARDIDALRVDEEGQPINEIAFEQRLEIERGDDHSAVGRMVAALNDPNMSFDQVLDRYFNRNNALMWITANLLMHQTDATTKNYYLFNPAGTERFYFLPWDYDGGMQPESILSNSFDINEVSKRQFFGYARGVRNTFLNKFLRQPGIQQDLLAAADYLRANQLSDANIDEVANRTIRVLEPFLTRAPDSENTDYSPNIAAAFSRFVAGIHADMSSRFAVPMPPTLEEPAEVNNGVLNLAWSPAYDVTGTNTSFTYDVAISTSVSFDENSIVYSRNGIPEAGDRTTHTVDLTTLPAQLLFVRLVARGNADPEQFWQTAFNDIRFDGLEYLGIISIDNQ